MEEIKSKEVDELIKNIDRQLLLKLLDSLAEEQYPTFEKRLLLGD